MKLGDLKPAAGSTKRRKRIGRGNASGWGRNAGRGEKGYGSRTGSKSAGLFEGGQMPLHRRLPKRGFFNIFKTNNAILNVTDLDRFEDGATIDIDSLRDAGMVKGRVDGVKILGMGEITKKFELKNILVSKIAKEKIEFAGGSIE